MIGAGYCRLLSGRVMIVSIRDEVGEKKKYDECTEALELPGMCRDIDANNAAFD